MSRDYTKQTNKYKKRQLAHMKYGYIIIFLCALFLPSYAKYQSSGINTYDIYIDETHVGTTDNKEIAENCLIDARRSVASESQELVLVDADLTYVESSQDYGILSTPEEITAKMAEVMRANTKSTLARSYILKIGQYTVVLSSIEDVHSLLQAALDKYQENRQFEVDINLDPEREMTVLTASVVKAEETQTEKTFDFREDEQAGIYAFLDEVFDSVEPAKEKDFSDYEQGIMDMYFGDPIEIVECYLPINRIEKLDKAVEEVTQDQAVPTIYEVVSGDTPSEIAEKVNIPLDDLIAMNEILQGDHVVIRVGDELKITVPQPKLSVERVEQLYYEEDYEAEIIYIPNDDWYTTDTKTLQEPSAGHHNVIASITYRNDDKTDVAVLKEEVTYEAVAKIVERGTKIPPSYIKPISGGRQSSTFGYRKRPTAGASTYHKGIDWAIPVGTAVMASSGGTVIKAGWGKGYGNVVYIQHPDGKVTRYGHLSKVLVSAGQTVSQGQKIALSGNTGVSTGPHLHFEILVNGSQVNPYNYIK